MTTPSTTTLPAQTLPLHDQWDVIVIGGGPAGCTAAAAAARAGAKTVLIESCGFLGGAATAMLVPAWCPFSDKVEQIYCGLAGTVFDRSKAGTWGVDPKRLDWVPIDPEWLKVVYDELMAEHGVTVRFHTNLVQVEADQGAVRRIITGSKAGLEAWEASVFIDCTGDADCAAWAGAAFQKGGEQGELQPGTMCFSLDHVDLETYRAGENLHPGNPNSPIYAILESGKYPEIPDKHMCNNPIGPSTLAFNAGHVYDVDNTDPDSVSRALPVGRKLTQVYRQALAEHVPGFEQCRVAATGAQLGIRETRRVIGDYMLTADDWFARRSFADEICRNAYFIDIHGGNIQQLAKERGMSTHYEPGEQHGIPYRCLCPKDLRNVLVAGRCISTDRTTQGSARVMPVCLAMGEAAGIAAAQAQREHGGDVHAVDTDRLRADLRAAGAYLP